MGESSGKSKESRRGGRSFQQFSIGRQDLLFSRGQTGAAACLLRRGLSPSECRGSCTNQRKSEAERIRGRVDICNRIRSVGPPSQKGSTFSTAAKGRDFEQREFRREQFWSGGRFGPNEKELARRGYLWRKGVKKEQGQIKVSIAGRSEKRQGFEFTRSDRRSPVEEYSADFGSSTSNAGHADSRSPGEKSSSSKEQQKQSFEQIRQFEVKSQSQSREISSKRPCKSNRELSGLETTYAEETSEVRQTVRPRSRRRAGGGQWETIQPSRHGPEGELGKTEESSTHSLHPFGSFDFAAKEKVRTSNSADNVGPQGHPSDGFGSRRLEPELVIDSSPQCLGSQAVGGIGGGTWKCGSISSVHGGAQQISRESSERTLGSKWKHGDQRCFGAASWERKRKRKIQEQGRRENRDLNLPPAHDRFAGAKPPVFNSIVEALERGQGSFSRFLKILHEEPFSHGSGPRTSSDTNRKINPLFPSLLVVPQRCISKSARVRSRARGREYTWKQCRIIWSLFTFLEGGSPCRYEDQVSLAYKALANPWTSLHQDYAGSLHDQVLLFNRLRCTDALGRGLEHLEKLVKLIRNSDYKPGLQQLSEDISCAMDVRPSRMSLPEKAGIINPADHLKGSHLEAFEKMLEVVPHDIPPDPPTKGCFKVRPHDVHEVYSKLLESGVATLIPEKLALRDESGNIVSAGLFAVPHKPDSDRIICDRRPLNELERRLVWARLPHGALLTQLIVPKGFSVRGSGDDLSNYFYLLEQKPEWLHRNVVGHVVSGQGFEKFGFDPNEKYILSFKVIPMGDLNAVDIAQQTHLEILRDCGVMSPSEVIAYRSPLPASPCLEGLYIDDHITIQVVPNRKLRRASKSVAFRDDEINHASRERYAKLGIPISKKKQFTKEYSFQAWGTSVDSVTGRVGTPMLKLKQLEGLLLDVCQLPKISQKLLQKTLGLLVHPCMHQRLIMSLLQEAYLFVNKLGSTGPAKLPKSVREELLLVGLLLPLCHSNVRWPVSSRIGASDASLKGGGRAVTLASNSVAQTLYRFSVHRGESVRLDWQKGALAPPSSMCAAPSELEELMNEHIWNTTHKCSFGHRQHINILEMKMVKAELQDLVMKDPDPARHVLLVDSRVCAGAWSKGRSSSKQLNRILRQMLGWALIGQKSLHLVWVKSEKNPADHPSRGCKIPEPPKEKPVASKISSCIHPEFHKRLSNRKIHRIAKTRMHSEHKDETASLPVSNPDVHPAVSKWQFREIFSGKGCLSQLFKDRSMFGVLPPFELLQNGKPSEQHDILNDKTYNRLIQDAKKPQQIWHFGMPCGSFSLMQNMNGGTRSALNPEGDNSLKRERIGNEIANRTYYLCRILLEHGNFFTIENPKTCWAWHLKSMKTLQQLPRVEGVVFDQCCYGLKIPDEKGILGLAKKPTRVIGNLPFLSQLHRQCKCTQKHVQIIGGVRTKNGWVRRSQLAGAYPRGLCSQYHRCCEKMFA